jgi:hypothetical protein
MGMEDSGLTRYLYCWRMLTQRFWNRRGNMGESNKGDTTRSNRQRHQMAHDITKPHKANVTVLV